MPKLRGNSNADLLYLVVEQQKALQQCNDNILSAQKLLRDDAD